MLEARRRTVRNFRRLRRKDGAMEPTRKSYVLSRDAYRRVVEERVRDRYDMSLTEFADAFRSGKLADDPAAYDLAVVSGVPPKR